MFTFLPEIDFAKFALPGDPFNHPVGAILYLLFPDVTGTEVFTLDYTQHPPFDVPPSGPGIYAGLGFLGGVSTGVIAASSGSVVVTEVPEPGTLLMASLGLLAILLVLSNKKLNWVRSKDSRYRIPVFMATRTPE
jgi:hypothetical protein